MALQSSSSSSSSFSYGFTYNVFLSFRGPDTRFGFTSNLYHALDRRGIRTFIDDRELQRGDEITPSLSKAIDDSRIAIIVFSIGYASSSFCLDELVHIIHCFKAKDRLVLPIFCDVDPSHVRHQTGSYGEGLAGLEERFKNNKENTKDNMETLQNWKKALNQAASLSGHHFKLRNEYEYDFIQKIVQEVSNKINRAPLHVADYPVGLESRLLQVNSLLGVGSDDGVCMLGIHGTGGMGKTTLAQAVYNSIADQFECLCFLHNVRENSSKHGLEYLQEKLLSKTVELNIKLGNVSEGIPIIKQRLHRKKVLLILDDVDELKQLQVMAGGLDWFGLGSKVIITTRDKHLLASHRIERTYEVVKLNAEESLDLLRWKAFKSYNKVDSSYKYVLKRAVTYASGLPLALEVVGSNLFGKDIKEWKSTLDRYERIPNKDIQKILKVSFDALEEDEQSVFLDIACCFKGYNLAKVEDILGAHHGECMKYHIGVLVEKSLVKISLFDTVTLHDLIEDMGKEIVRQESPKEPGKRSRLWFHKDIVQVLEENTGTSQNEIIYLDFPLYEEEVVEWKGDELKKMKNLKTLIIKNGRFSKGPEHLPNSLRVLEWRRYPSQNMPSDFCPKKLSICKLRESGLTSFQLCGSLKRFVNIREINFDYCQSLTQIPDVSGLQNLEILSFQSCENLLIVHDSVGFLNKLEILDAKNCRKLKSFPPLELTSLQKLELSRCKSLISFPEISGEMKNVKKIYFEDTFIEELPLSFQNLTGLQHLLVCNNYQEIRLPSSILMMPKLSTISASSGRILLPKDSDTLSSMVSTSVRELDLINCCVSDEFLSILRFVNVEALYLSENDFTILPEWLKECHFLKSLYLDDCKFLREIRGIPPNLEFLSAKGCKSLTPSCRSMLLSQELHKTGCIGTILSGTERIPKWFEHQSKGPSISFWFRNEFPSVALFFTTESMQYKPFIKEDIEVRLIINGYKISLDGGNFYGLDKYLSVESDHTYLFDLIPQLRELESKLEKELLKNEWIHAEVRYEYDSVDWHGNEVMIPIPFGIKSGIHIFKQKSSREDVQFTNPSLQKKRKLDDDGGYY